MIALFSNKTYARFATAAALVSLVLGCSTAMGGDGAGNQMGSGIAEARNGLSKTQSGVTAITAGSRQTGIGNISDGMGMMGQGVGDVRQGMSMMSGNMMMSCADGGSDAVLVPMQQAMNEMQQGQSMLGVDAATSDDEGMAHVQNGMSMMKTALDHAQSSMNCMGHNGMMSGSMM